MKFISCVLLLLAFGLLGLGIYRVVTAGVTAAQSQSMPICWPLAERDSAITLSYVAIDDAFKKHVGELFKIWVSDPADQPRRAKAGMQINLSAYHRARANVREWEPEICK